MRQYLRCIQQGLVLLLFFMQALPSFAEPRTINIAPDIVEEKLPKCVSDIKDMRANAEEYIVKTDKAISTEKIKRTTRRHLSEGNSYKAAGDMRSAKKSYEKAASFARGHLSD